MSSSFSIPLQSLPTRPPISSRRLHHEGTVICRQPHDHFPSPWCYRVNNRHASLHFKFGRMAHPKQIANIFIKVFSLCFNPSQTLSPVHTLQSPRMDNTSMEDNTKCFRHHIIHASNSAPHRKWEHKAADKLKTLRTLIGTRFGQEKESLNTLNTHFIHSTLNYYSSAWSSTLSEASMTKM